MRISVIIPAYNEEAYLPKTLESLKRLQKQPDEIIVVDGGSYDATQKIARSYGAVVVIAKNSTVSIARQKGLEAATGDIVATTDADTVVPADWLDKIIETLQQPGVVGTYSGYRVDDGRLFYQVFINWIHPAIFSLSQWSAFPISPGQNTAYWREKTLKAGGGYPTEFKSAEDIELARRLKKIGTVRYRHDNYVTSSGRRSKEGFALVWRMATGLFRYFLIGKADTFDFPNIR